MHLWRGLVGMFAGALAGIGLSAWIVWDWPGWTWPWVYLLTMTLGVACSAVVGLAAAWNWRRT